MGWGILPTCRPGPTHSTMASEACAALFESPLLASAATAAMAIVALRRFRARPQSVLASAGDGRRQEGQMVLEGVPEIPPALRRDLQRYQNTRGAALEAWSPRGLLVSLRFGDVRQVHEVTHERGARSQLTFFSEPVGAVEHAPDGSGFVFSMDEGGNETSQLLFFRHRDARVTRLSDGASRYNYPLFAPDGRLAYMTNRRDKRLFDIEVSAAPVSGAGSAGDTAAEGALAGSRRVVTAEAAGYWCPVAWCPASRHLLAARYVSINECHLRVVDVHTGAVTEVTAPAGEGGETIGAAMTAAWTHDGAGFFFATDEGAEFRLLRYFHLATRASSVVVPAGHTPWDVCSVALSDPAAGGGDSLVFSVNEDGVSAVYHIRGVAAHLAAARAAGDAAAAARPWPAPRRLEGLPVGVLTGLRFSPGRAAAAGGTQGLALSFSAADSPGEVLVLPWAEGGPAGAAAPTVWVEGGLGGLRREGLVVPELVRFPADDGLSIPAFLYRPRPERLAGRRSPVIVLIHGGPESQARPRFSALIQYLVAELGVTVAQPNVRGSSGYGKRYCAMDNGANREKSPGDIGALLRWLRARPEVDRERIAVLGGSYGGYMVLACLIRYGDWLRCGCEIVGISNFVTFLENTSAYRRDLRREKYGDERDPQMRRFLTRISPTTHAARIACPLLIAQGANDPRVPASEAEQIRAAVEANGQAVWYMLARNEGHGFKKKANSDLYQQAQVLFWRRFLLDGLEE